MIARIKGLKISQASERTAVTGQEMIPFQDGERNGKIRMIEFKDMTMYIFDPTIVDGKVSQEDYDALKQAIEEGKLIYTINSNRNGLDLATEVAIVSGTIYILNLLTLLKKKVQIIYLKQYLILLLQMVH